MRDGLEDAPIIVDVRPEEALRGRRPSANQSLLLNNAPDASGRHQHPTRDMIASVSGQKAVMCVRREDRMDEVRRRRHTLRLSGPDK